MSTWLETARSMIFWDCKRARRAQLTLTMDLEAYGHRASRPAADRPAR